MTTSRFKRRIILAATLAACSFSAGSAANDRGFYLRGHWHVQEHRSVPLTDNVWPGSGSWFGYGQPNNPFGFVVNGNPDPGTPQPHSKHEGAGFAVGYRFNQWLRADLSWDRTGNSRIRFDYPTFAGGTDDHVWYTISTKQLMANVSLDLAPLAPEGSLGRFEPYVTLGVGRSYNSNSDYRCTSTNACTALEYANANTYSDRAWSAGGGVVFQLTPAWGIDVAVRYLNLGKTQGKDVGGTNAAWGLNGPLEAWRYSLGFSYQFGAR